MRQALSALGLLLAATIVLYGVIITSGGKEEQQKADQKAKQILIAAKENYSVDKKLMAVMLLYDSKVYNPVADD
jgi:hypothetical protein